MSRRTAYQAEQIVRETEALASLVEDAQQVQYLPARKPGTAEDSGIRSKGVHSDPTGDTALDEKRLRLSQRLQQAERTLAAMVKAATLARVNLENALEAWAGTLGDG